MEILITLCLLSVAFMAAVATFSGMAKGVLVTKTKSLATNLAQEKIEYLKDKSYYRLRVSSAATSSTYNGTTVWSDPYNYAPEQLNVGGIPFTRYTVVDKVKKDASSTMLNSVPWNDPDTGIKRMTVSIVWQESGDYKVLQLTNLSENPSRAGANVDFSGVVRDTNSVALSNITVEVVENPSWSGATDNSGAYSFAVEPGTWTLRASATSFFAATQSGRSVDTTNTPVTTDFTLPRRNWGSVYGSVWKRDHLVISQVAASIGGDDSAEFVELYNPTTAAITIAVGASRQFIIKYVDASGTVTEFNPAWPGGSTAYVKQTIPPNGFYTFASEDPITASSVWIDAYNMASPSANIIPLNQEGGIRLEDTAGNLIDAVGWGRSGHAPYSSVQEGGTFIDMDGGSGHNGFADNETIERIAYASSTLAMMEPTGTHASRGNAYDNNNTSACWVHHSHSDPSVYGVSWSSIIQSVTGSSSETVGGETGTPASGGYVFADDGFSSAVSISSTGTFVLTNIATGTWTLSASSSTLYNGSAVTVTSGSTQKQVIVLSSSTDNGYVSGSVASVGGTALSGIVISPGGTSTDSNGFFRLAMSPGYYTLTANPSPGGNPSYIEDSTTVLVNTGQMVSGVDFVLSGGGYIRGRVTIDGTNALPDIPVSITNSGTSVEMANTMTKSDGYFQTSVPTGTYVVTPIGEFGESVSPTSKTVTVTSGSTIFSSSFTISGAYGTISGSVLSSSQAITTGVLIIASTMTVSNPPPTNNATLRSGGQVYYMNSSGVDGTYNIDVRPGTYYVYGWYSTVSGTTATTAMRSLSGVSVTAGATTSGKNLSW